MKSKKEKQRRRKEREKRRKAKAALRITKKAQDELGRLLKRDQAGTVTRDDLDTGLQEVHEEMTSIMRFVRASL